VLGVASNQIIRRVRYKKAASQQEKQQAEAVDNNTEGNFDGLLAEFARHGLRATAAHTAAGANCFSHFVPEVHGCGQAAREAARRVRFPVRPLPVLWRPPNPTGRLCDGPSCIAGWSEAGRHGAVKAAGVCCLCGGGSTDLLEVASFASSPLNSKKAAAPQGRKTMTAADVELALVEAEFEAFLRLSGVPGAPGPEGGGRPMRLMLRMPSLSSNDANSGPTATLDDLDDIMNAPRRSYVDALVQFHAAPSSSCDEDKAGSKDADDNTSCCRGHHFRFNWRFALLFAIPSALASSCDFCFGCSSLNVRWMQKSAAATARQQQQPQLPVPSKSRQSNPLEHSRLPQHWNTGGGQVQNCHKLHRSVSNQKAILPLAQHPFRMSGQHSSSTGSGGSADPQQRPTRAPRSSRISTFCIIFAVRMLARRRSINKA
uniref:Os05g0520600 protein n=1 Tax=Macrostomum lignano TaxID=282301 RepID=A0A1I8JNT1_9PLAT